MSVCAHFLSFHEFKICVYVFKRNKELTYLSEQGMCSHKPQSSHGTSASPGFEFLLQEWGIAQFEEVCLGKDVNRAIELST